MRKMTDRIAARITGEIGMGKNTGYRRPATHDEIAQLAYALWESRGRSNGHHMDDWLRAEKELTHRAM
jgi:hypothetical protein